MPIAAGKFEITPSQKIFSLAPHKPILVIFVVLVAFDICNIPFFGGPHALAKS
jgi:hypothetical protein